MQDAERRRRQGHQTLVERRVQRITEAHSATLGLAVTFMALSIVGGVVIRFIDPHNFSSVGEGIWWALQTVTTVGYGDVVPTSVLGRVVGGIEMVTGVAFIAFVTAGVTSSAVYRRQSGEHETERQRNDERAQAMLAALDRTNATLARLDERLGRIEQK